MIYWLRLFGLIFIFVCIVAVVGSVLPRSYDFEVAQTIEATPEIIFERIDQFPDWQSWSQWSTDNENIHILQFSERGKVMQWTDSRGKGTMTMVDSKSGKSLEFTSNYGDFPEMISEMNISTDAGFTVIAWRSQGTLPSGPFYGYFSPFFANGMRGQYIASLRKLKNECEEVAKKAAQKQNQQQ